MKYFPKLGQKNANFVNPTNSIERESIFSSDLAEKVVWFVGLKIQISGPLYLRECPPESVQYHRN